MRQGHLLLHKHRSSLSVPTNKRPKKIGRNYNDNDNEAFTKNRTFNCKNEENNSLLDLLDNSNKENKNNDLNKNIKILNKSNNNS